MTDSKDAFGARRRPRAAPKTRARAAATTALALFCGAFVASAQAESRPGTPPELGRVRWSRDFESTRRSSTKPILLLFQEVPG